MSLVPQQRPKLKAISMLCLGFGLVLIGLLMLAGFFTNQALVTFSQGKTKQATVYVNLAQPILNLVNLGSINLSPDLESWHHALAILDNVIQLTVLGEQLTAQLTGSASDPSSPKISSAVVNLEALQNHLHQFNQLYPRTWLTKRYINPEFLTKLQTAAQILPVLTALTTGLEQDPDQTWVILLQNSDEIRATGGFVGSYALLQFSNGRFADLTIEDIYDADGQFKGYITAPPGIREYTSGNHGLRLPDANWWPDFPKSAQTMLQFFAFGNRQDISGVIAINLPLVANLLEVTGPVWLPDNQVELTSTNIHQLLRSKRDSFFPGSQQKKNILNHSQSMLIQKLSQLSKEDKFRVVSLLLDSLNNKNIQIYATQPNMQAKIASAQISGTLGQTPLVSETVLKDCGCQPRIIMQVESNVGINKVNAHIERTSTLEFTANHLQITTTFSNAAPQIGLSTLGTLVTDDQIAALTTKDNQNGYVNYHRFYVDPTYQVEAILIDDQVVTKWDDNLIVSSDDTELREVGVLVATTAGNQTTLSISFSTLDGFAPPIVLIPKQAGIPNTSYQINTPDKSFTMEHDQDLLLQLR